MSENLNRQKEINARIFVDGGARGNPGVAGAGAVIEYEGKKYYVKKFLGTATNNEAEYSAVILGLTEAKKIMGKERARRAHITVYMDSELVARQLSGVYQIKEERLFAPFIKIWNMRVADFGDISFIHIPRAENVEADHLANKAMDEGKG